MSQLLASYHAGMLLLAMSRCRVSPFYHWRVLKDLTSERIPVTWLVGRSLGGLTFAGHVFKNWLVGFILIRD